MNSPQISPSLIKEQGQEALLVKLSEQLTWSQKEAAVMCGISVATYSKLRNAGVLPGPINGTTRYSAHAVRQALMTNSETMSEPGNAYAVWRASRG